LQIDESSFTGENEPRQKHSNKIEKNEELSGKSEANSNSLQTFDNIAFMGTLVCSGRGKVIRKWKKILKLINK
jgi:magnesium-transporting ATPase (P-type)